MKNNQISPTPWYTEEADFFGLEYLEEYESSLTQERTLNEVNFIEKILSLKPGIKILDCPCGYGRHSIELARRGYNVTGLDLNSFFLKKAKKAAESIGVSIRWIQADMRKIPFEDEFDVVLNLFTSFGYLENDNEDQKVLNQVAKALKQKGKFLLDVINRDYVLRYYREKDWQQLSDNSIVLIERHFDYITGRNFEKRTRIWNNGKRKEYQTSLRLYTVAELVAMLRKSGFNIVRIYGDYDGSPFALDSKRCIIVSEKC